MRNKCEDNKHHAHAGNNHTIAHNHTDGRNEVWVEKDIPWINPCVNNTNWWNIWNHQLYQFDVSTIPIQWGEPQRKVTYSKLHPRILWKNNGLFQCRMYWSFPHAPYLQSLVVSRSLPIVVRIQQIPMYIITPPPIIFTRIWQTAMRHNGWLAVVSPQILYRCLIHRKATD